MLPRHFEHGPMSGSKCASSFVRSACNANGNVLHRCATGDGFTAERSGRNVGLAALDPKADALVRISALAALGAPEGVWGSAIARAFEEGACDEDIVATLISVATIIGQARVAAVAPAIAAASATRSTAPSRSDAQSGDVIPIG